MTYSSPPSRDEIFRFRAMLGEFRRLNAIPRGDADRFQFLCEQIFGVFGRSGVWAPEWNEHRLLSANDNLDTGNPSWPPPEAFLTSMFEGLNQPDNLRGYYRGFARDDLREAVQNYLQDKRILPSGHSVDVVAGAGTVHLYDLLCRHLIRRHNDVMLSVIPFYGFFLPHAERSGGQTRLLRPDDGYRCSPELVESAIKAINEELNRDWSATAEHRVVSCLTHAATHLDVRLERSWFRKVAQALSRLTWPSQPERCDEALFAVLEPLLADAGLSWPGLAGVGKLPTVPRVVAWFQMNPTQGGDVYRQEHVTALAPVLRANGVAPIEDLAYHSIRWPLDEMGSYYRTGVSTYQLLGLSKPFGLANCRVGLLTTDTGNGYQLGLLVENSAGWMPTFYQAALRDLLASDAGDRYLQWNSFEAPDNYATRCCVALAAFRGRRNDRTAPAETLARVRTIVRTVAADVLRTPDAASGGALGDSDRLVEEFLEQGVSAWLSVPRPPEAGFLVMVDCSALIESPVGRALDLRSAIDVCAMLSYFAGVRTVPEEAMTVASMAAGSRLLRMSFSVPITRWVLASFLVFLRLRQLTLVCADTGDEHR